MCLEHPQFSALLRSPKWTKDVFATLNIDEAHCISQWGDNFRAKFKELGRLRSYFPLHVPVLATTATAPPRVLEEIHETLGFRPETTFHLNLGNNRPNITYHVRRLKGAESDYDALNWVVDDVPEGGRAEPTMIFCEKRETTQRLANHLRDRAKEPLKTRIAYYHAGRSKRARRKIMKKFREGEIDILCTTEAAGMVSNKIFWQSYVVLTFH